MCTLIPKIKRTRYFVAPPKLTSLVLEALRCRQNLRQSICELYLLNYSNDISFFTAVFYQSEWTLRVRWMVMAKASKRQDEKKTRGVLQFPYWYWIHISGKVIFLSAGNNILRAVNGVRLRQWFMNLSPMRQWAAWDLVSLSQSYHVNSYIDTLQNLFVVIKNYSRNRTMWTPVQVHVQKKRRDTLLWKYQSLSKNLRTCVKMRCIKYC